MNLARCLVMVLCLGGLFLARPAPALAAASPIKLAFYEGGGTDPTELASRLNHITDLAPTGEYLAADATLQVETNQRATVQLAHARGVRVFPMVQNYRDGRFRGEDLNWLESPVARRSMAAEMLRRTVEADADGVNLDFEELPAALRPAFASFVAELSDEFHAAAKRVQVDLPVNHAAYDTGALAAASDWLVLMAYDEHSLPGQPGAIAGYPWVNEALAALTREVPAGRIILGLAGYGYDWSEGKVEPLSFPEALKRAARPEAIQWDARSREPWFNYRGPTGALHLVWFSDAASLQPLVHEGQLAHVAGFALWRLGQEDMGMWDLLDGHLGVADVPSLVSVGATRTGGGEVALSSRAEQPGRRQLSWERGVGLVGEERYLALPQPLQINTTNPRQGTVALTFDDGPDPRWTPRVLDILHAYGAQATFFIVGSQAIKQPRLLSRMRAEGNELGNHTYNHPAALESAPEWRFSLELSATQRVTEAATGHSATLFRYPYMTSLAEPQDADQAAINRVARLGYQLVGQASDTSDWTRPGSGEIAARALANPDGQVILLHDGGGDRSQTVAALPAILDGLRARGLRPVTVTEAIGQPAEVGMPEAGRLNIGLGLILLGFGWILVNGWSWWLAIASAVLLLVFGRILLLSLLGFAHWISERRQDGPAHRGPVTVLIAAHNEEPVIARTLEALLRTDYPELEIVVIDDGSSDGTAGEVAAFAERGVRLVRQPQSGKARALRAGFAWARHPIVVALDADTLFARSTVGHLVRPFANRRVAAVAGTPKVGNRVNVLTWFQVVEYVLTLNLERRAYALFGCVPVVPGAVGAWRRAAVEEVGGFSGATLAEDADLTMALARRGYRIEYAPRAVAYTEAPQTLGGLNRQRSRWAFGMLQCLWKHRRATFSPRAGALGFVAIPGMWMVQLLLPLVAPTIDLTLVLSPFLAWAPQVVAVTLVYNAALVLVAMWALAVDREPVILALLVPLQNFFYRQFLYFMALKAVVRALRGVRIGWNPVARLGTSSIGGESLGSDR
jgi:cellulose synthase/poly-beta-1,6-N-acetylglucosamine synthase-like glycosyltransferase/peptidoglycan/xylan/chitin deacetylase (PgdA/CDA1 family)/spore germination protein YaaH